MEVQNGTKRPNVKKRHPKLLLRFLFVLVSNVQNFFFAVIKKIAKKRKGNLKRKKKSTKVLFLSETCVKVFLTMFFYKGDDPNNCLTLDHMGTPLKNQNFKNRTSSYFKLAQISASKHTYFGFAYTRFYHIIK